jgi:SAM-dependent methyltransferase
MTADAHVLASASAISEAARLAGGGSAALLGCGRCGEIPLLELTTRFRSIDLVDVENSALEVVAARCRNWNGVRWRFFKADLTGLIERLRRKGQEIAAAATDWRTCLDSYCELLDGCTVEFWTPPENQRFDLVVCSAVLTQLQTGPRKALQDAARQAFPHDAGAMTAHEAWRNAIWRFARTLEERFVGHLETLCSDRGVIYLADTVHVCWVEEREPAQFRTEGAWVATRTSHLKDYLHASNEVLFERRWRWMRWQPEGRYAGRLYGVQAVAYRPSRQVRR